MFLVLWLSFLFDCWFLIDQKIREDQTWLQMKFEIKLIGIGFFVESDQFLRYR